MYNNIIRNRYRVSFVLILLSLILLSSCILKRPLTGVALEDKPANESDSTAYEIIVLDPGFEGWYLSHSKPIHYHSQSWLEFQNRQYVAAWNARVGGGVNSRFFVNTIDYQHNLDYGLEVNHRLFYYFQYVEVKLGIPILSARRPSQFIR